MPLIREYTNLRWCTLVASGQDVRRWRPLRSTPGPVMLKL